MPEMTERLQKWIGLRREFHAHAETGWTEFWTTARIAGILDALGYDVLAGREVLNLDAVMGRPGEEEIGRHVRRALDQGADPRWIARMEGYTGVLGILETGRPGPVVAFRFDIDAVDVSEAADEKHRPFREGFSSRNGEAAHACGHDAHAAMGVALAEILMERKEDLSGTFKLVFQPAEEGVRGGKAMAEKGFLHDVDYFIGAHVGMGIPTGTVVPECGDFLCTTKFDLTYTGKPAHAGGSPNEGRNALLAAASAALALAGIPPHRDGATRINVGVLQAGTGRNVIPARAFMKVETRGLTGELNSYVYNRAMEVVSGAAAMYGVEMSVAKMGEAVDVRNDETLAKLVAEKALEVEGIERIAKRTSLGGSEDVSWMMRAVQKRGGKAVYFVLGSDTAAGHHNGYFDLDEQVLSYGPPLFAKLAISLSPRGIS